MGQAGYETVHQVTLTQGYYLGKFEVTQAQYEADDREFTGLECKAKPVVE